VVAGLSDTDTTSRLHVAIAEGPGWSGGWLTSAGTGRDGYLQLVGPGPDRVLAALAPAAPDRLFSGRAPRPPGRPANLPTRAAAARRGRGPAPSAASHVSSPCWRVQVLLFAWSCRDGAGPAARRPGGARSARR
jgi:hypothetical protein